MSITIFMQKPGVLQFFMSIYAAFQLECLTLKHKMNHFALRSRISIKALQQAMCELHSLKNMSA